VEIVSFSEYFTVNEFGQDVTTICTANQKNCIATQQLRSERNIFSTNEDNFLLLKQNATNRFAGLNIPPYSCPNTSCYLYRFSLDSEVFTQTTYLERPHPLIWLSVIGSYVSLTYTIMGTLVSVFISAIVLLVSKVKFLNFLKVLFVHPGEYKEEERNIFLSILNLGLFRPWKFRGKTYAGVFLTFLFFIILIVTFILLMVDNYTSIFVNRGKFTDVSPFVLKYPDFNITKTFVCTNPEGCFVLNAQSFKIDPFRTLERRGYIKNQQSMDLLILPDVYLYFYANKTNKNFPFQTLNEFGYFINGNDTKKYVRGYNIGPHQNYFGENHMNVIKEVYEEDPTKTNFLFE
jgi:hypothetical protein